MKKVYLFIIYLFTIPLCFSQIKLHSNGNVSIATTVMPPLNNAVYLYGPRLTFGGYNNNTFKLDCSAKDVRLWSTTGTIAFYNTENLNFCHLQAKSFIISSDARYKTDIKDIDNALDKILLLNGVSYHLKDKSTDLKSASMTATFGFIAQEAENVIPDIVLTDSAGYKAMDYLGIIPYLVESVKELNTKIEDQKQYIQEMESKSSNIGTSNSDLINGSSAKLFSNHPNPFNSQTTIKYYVPIDAKNSVVNIYDLTGKQIISNKIATLGSGEIIISAFDLSPGIFLYSLLIDGIEIDTKRMIVTE